LAMHSSLTLSIYCLYVFGERFTLTFTSPDHDGNVFARVCWRETVAEVVVGEGTRVGLCAPTSVGQSFTQILLRIEVRVAERTRSTTYAGRRTRLGRVGKPLKPEGGPVHDTAACTSAQNAVFVDPQESASPLGTDSLRGTCGNVRQSPGLLYPECVIHPISAQSIDWLFTP